MSRPGLGIHVVLLLHSAWLQKLSGKGHASSAKQMQPKSKHGLAIECQYQWKEDFYLSG